MTIAYRVGESFDGIQVACYTMKMGLLYGVGSTIRENSAQKRDEKDGG